MQAHERQPGGKTSAGQRAARPTARPARTAAPRPRGPLGPDAILALQSAAGNRAVSRILAGDRDREPADGEAPGRSPGADVQRVATGENGLPVIQRRWRQGTMSGEDPTFTPDHDRAGTAEVRHLKGEPLDEGANAPVKSGNPRGWDNLKNKGFTKLAKGGEKPIGNPYRAVRMHLFNGRLGGPGDNKHNLAPGPGKINSMMSAQAEDPAKRLVEGGNDVWLKTTVKYKHDTVSNDDFTSVVPNHITMEWGVEGDPDSDESWSSQIPLPVDSLAPDKVKLYQAWTGSKEDLVKELDEASDQERAQILGLVPTIDAKMATLEKCPALYRGVSGADKVNYIMHFSDAAARLRFLQAMGVTWNDISPDDIYIQALAPLYQKGHLLEAAEIFELAGMTGATGSRMRDRYGDDFIETIGGPDAGARLVEQQGGAGILKRCSDSYRPMILDALRDRETLRGALPKTIESHDKVFQWLDRWALHNGKNTSQEKIEYISSELPEWEAIYKKTRYLHNMASTRPPRAKRTKTGI